MELLLKARSLMSPLLIIPVLVLLVFSPLSGEEGEGVPLAIGFLGPDGTTGVAEFTGQIEEQPETVYATGYGIPSEPLGHRLVRLTNRKRINNGRPPLKAASELLDSAEFHSQWMADHNCFAHRCSREPDWVTRIENAGYLNGTTLAENLAAGYTTASAAVNAWMGSSGHRAIMLNRDFREAGGGYAFSGSSTYHHYWTMDFGARNNAHGDPVYPVIINNEAWSTASPEVDLYLYGSGWARQMRFRNGGGNWSDWESFSADKPWTLDIPFSVQPDQMIFLSEQGGAQTIPEQYEMTINSCGNSLTTVYARIKRGSTVLENSDDIYLDNCCESWNANDNRGWIELSDYGGSGSATVTVYLRSIPTDPGTYSGKITVTTASQEHANIQVTLVVTEGPLERSYVPQSIVASE